MSLLFTILGLLVILEILGRILYPFTPEAKSRREASRDHRRGLSYLGTKDNSLSLIRDIYLMKKRYLPFLGWLGAPNTKLETVATNALGFRDKEIIPRTVGVYRILLIGGSFTWGLGATDNSKTVAGQLEKILNQKDGPVRYLVMSGSFLNWTSRHEYIVLTELFDTFDPDLVISLSGYNDLVALAKGIEIDELPEAALLSQAVISQVQATNTLQALKKLVGTLGIWRIFVMLRELSSINKPCQQCYHYDSENGISRVKRILHRYLSISDYIARKKRRYLIALEPEIYSSKKMLTIEEFDLKNHFMNLDYNLQSILKRYRGELRSMLTEYAGDQFKLLDLADVFDNETRPVFIDYNHVCDLGNQLVAQEIANTILTSRAESVQDFSMSLPQ